MNIQDGKKMLWPGQSWPLGATWDGKGVNFALFSAHAEKIELCLFDDSGTKELSRLPMREYTDAIWYGYLPEARPGLVYGYRVYGPYNPRRGHRFNHHKVLLDPYARQLRGTFVHHPANFGYTVGGDPNDPANFDTRDNTAYVPKAVVTVSDYPWPDRPPSTLWQETLIYETHVRGMTMRHPDVPEHKRGTFAGLATSAVIDHLRDLGVTAVELMPITPVLDESHLVQHGLRNFWGYNPYAYFTIEPRYLASGHIDEFRMTVERLHDAGIEVILDVVFNHTGEGNHHGPTLSFRGIDNASYYCLESDRSRYVNHSGCGNCLDLSHPRVLQMVTDALRYWVTEMHVDGFRFDLTTTLARVAGHFEPHAPFLAAIRQDPVLARVKLIAEPWDLGPGGYRLGGFPPGWSEWNDRYRDTVRSFWRGTEGIIGDMAYRLTGSSDHFDHLGRQPRSSINFVTAHDGFTLEDLVSYEQKHNQANHEHNRDGASNNNSWNCGIEGPTSDPAITALRFQQKRNLISTLLLSQGVPMLVAGDELGHTRNGNNNTYCQDNETSWLDWSLKRPEDRAFLAFVKKLSAIRKAHPVFRRPNFFHGEFLDHAEVKDITWLSPTGRELDDDEWRRPHARCFGFHLGGDTGNFLSRTGVPLIDSRFIGLLNAHHDVVPFTLPERRLGSRWQVVFDTARPHLDDSRDLIFASGETYRMKGFSFVLLVHLPSHGRSDAAEGKAPDQTHLPLFGGDA